MQPGGGSGVMKPIHVDPEDMGLHDTDISELSASTAPPTLPQVALSDEEKAQKEEEKK